MANPWLLAARPKTLPAAIAPVLIGTALAIQSGEWEPLAALVCLLFALLIQVGTNYANDYFDFVKGADTEKRIGPTRAVAAGLVSPRAMLMATIVVLAMALLVGMTLVAFGGWWLLLVGFASVACAILYTGGPYPLGYHGWGDVFVFVFFGLVAVMFTYYVQTGYFSWSAFLGGAGCGLLSTNILVANNMRDIETDRVAGKRTLAVRFGRAFAETQYRASLLIALLIPLVLAYLTGAWLAVLPLLMLPLAIQRWREIMRAEDRESHLRLLGKTAQFLVFWSVLLTAGLILS